MATTKATTAVVNGFQVSSEIPSLKKLQAMGLYVLKAWCQHHQVEVSDDKARMVQALCYKAGVAGVQPLAPAKPAAPKPAAKPPTKPVQEPVRRVQLDEVCLACTRCGFSHKREDMVNGRCPECCSVMKQELEDQTERTKELNLPRGESRHSDTTVRTYQVIDQFQASKGVVPMTSAAPNVPDVYDMTTAQLRSEVVTLRVRVKELEGKVERLEVMFGTFLGDMKGLSEVVGQLAGIKQQDDMEQYQRDIEETNRSLLADQEVDHRASIREVEREMDLPVGTLAPTGPVSTLPTVKVRVEMYWGKEWTGSYWAETKGKGLYVTVMEVQGNSFRGCPLGRPLGGTGTIGEAMEDFVRRGAPEFLGEGKLTTFRLEVVETLDHRTPEVATPKFSKGDKVEVQKDGGSDAARANGHNTGIVEWRRLSKRCKSLKLKAMGSTDELRATLAAYDAADEAGKLAMIQSASK